MDHQKSVNKQKYDQNKWKLILKNSKYDQNNDKLLRKRKIYKTWKITAYKKHFFHVC